MAAVNSDKDAAGAPFPETADIETASDDFARRFAGPTGAWMLGIQERIARAMLAGMPGARIVDVGGGHGQLAVPLCRAGYAVTVAGSDDACRGRIADVLQSGQCRFVRGNLIALPLPDRSFEAAISFRLLPHCEAWPALIRELCRVAQNAVIVDYPTSQGINALAPALFGAKKKFEGNTRTWRSFRHDEVRRAFEDNGFRVVRREGQFFLPMALHRMLRCRPLSAGLEAMCRGLGLTRRWGSPVIVKAERVATQGGGERG